MKICFCWFYKMIIVTFAYKLFWHYRKTSLLQSLSDNAVNVTFIVFNTAAKQKITVFAIIQMSHCDRYFAISRETYTICTSSFSVYCIRLFYAKCFF